MAEELDDFVPVGARTLDALAGSVAAAREAERALSVATEAMLELAEDLSMDALRGLRDRGASAAQIERYEVAHREASRAVRERLGALENALARMQTAADRVGG